jgi:putative heme iron utilization protein
MPITCKSGTVMSNKINPIRDTDAQARVLARRILSDARFGALGEIDPTSSSPMVTRIAVATAADGTLLSLMSNLSLHTTALGKTPICSLLIGEPGPKGDPLSHPRLTLQCRAEPIEKSGLRVRYLSLHPKAQLYFDFADFQMVALRINSAFLNGGFGKAYHLTAAELIL